jgi:hypothetical protein
MNNKFDELGKGLVQSTTRRQALKKCGVSLAAMALACFALTKRAEAAHHHLPPGYCCVTPATSGYAYDGTCLDLRTDNPSICGSCPPAGTAVGRDANIQHMIACGGFCSLFVDLNEKCNC